MNESFHAAQASSVRCTLHYVSDMKCIRCLSIFSTVHATLRVWHEVYPLPQHLQYGARYTTCLTWSVSAVRASSVRCTVHNVSDMKCIRCQSIFGTVHATLRVWHEVHPLSEHLRTVHATLCSSSSNQDRILGPFPSECRPEIFMQHAAFVHDHSQKRRRRQYRMKEKQKHH